MSYYIGTTPAEVDQVLLKDIFTDYVEMKMANCF